MDSLKKTPMIMNLFCNLIFIPMTHTHICKILICIYIIHRPETYGLLYIICTGLLNKSQFIISFICLYVLDGIPRKKVH